MDQEKDASTARLNDAAILTASPVNTLSSMTELVKKDASPARLAFVGFESSWPSWHQLAFVN